MMNKKYYYVRYWNSYRDYTYESDETLEEGDFVIVEANDKLTVARVSGEAKKPDFICKEILGRIKLV